MPNVHHNHPDEPEHLVTLDELPPAPTTMNGRRARRVAVETETGRPPDRKPGHVDGAGLEPPSIASPTADRHADLAAFDEQYTVPPEDLEVEDVDAATAVPEVGGPGRQAYFRADPARTWTGRLLRDEDSGTYYLLAQSVEHSDAAVYRLHLLVTRKGTLRLWPVRMPVNGDDFPSARQQRAILADAAVMWTSCQWKGGKRGRWHWRRFPDLADVPRWPNEPMLRLVQRAFDGATIDDPHDPRLLAIPQLD
jgi:hypothetical protein